MCPTASALEQRVARGFWPRRSLSDAWNCKEPLRLSDLQEKETTKRALVRACGRGGAAVTVRKGWV